MQNAFYVSRVRLCGNTVAFEKFIQFISIAEDQPGTFGLLMKQFWQGFKTAVHVSETKLGGKIIPWETQTFYWFSDFKWEVFWLMAEVYWRVSQNYSLCVQRTIWVFLRIWGFFHQYGTSSKTLHYCWRSIWSRKWSNWLSMCLVEDIVVEFFLR